MTVTALLEGQGCERTWRRSDAIRREHLEEENPRGWRASATIKNLCLVTASHSEQDPEDEISRTGASGWPLAGNRYQRQEGTGCRKASPAECAELDPGGKPWTWLQGETNLRDGEWIKSSEAWETSRTKEAVEVGLRSTDIFRWYREEGGEPQGRNSEPRGKEGSQPSTLKRR